MSVRPTYTTSKGTILPLLNLKGKEYLQVPHRMVWFREELPSWRIETSLVEFDGNHAIARAVIRDDQGNVMATAHKSETVNGFPDFIEKAETGAIGRALLMIGYGTAFCADELDEGNRLADSPVDPVGMTKVEGERSPVKNSEANLNSSKSDLPYKVPFGRKYKGHTLHMHPVTEWEAYLKWLKDTSVRDGTSLHGEVQLFEKELQKHKAAGG